MSNIVEYTLSLADKVSGTLTKIGIANDKQLETWAKVQQKVVAADHTMKQCGVTIGSLRGRVDALRTEKEWIPANNINAIRRTNIEIKSLEKQINKLETVNGGRLKGWFENLKTSVPIVNMVTNPLILMGAALYKVGNYIKGSQEAWRQETEAQTKLAAVLRNTAGARKEEIDNILNLASAQQKLGVVGDEVQVAGAQELSTYITKTESLKKLMPVMNDMLAQQYGYNATQEQASNIAMMMGKVMDGQTGALSRYGYKFSEAQEKILKYGNEAQRAATLAEVISSAVGGVNEALAQTPEGRLKQFENNLSDIQERVGKIYTDVKAALLPLFAWLQTALNNTVVWFENNQGAIVGFVTLIAETIKTSFAIIGSILKGVVFAFNWWGEKLRENNPLITGLTIVLGALTLVMIGFAAQAKMVVFWSTAVARAKMFWAAAQNKLNLAIWASPTTWIIAGIIALIAVIAYLCYKIEGWGSLWKGIVGFMKYSFLGFIEEIKLGYTSFVNGFMIGLNYIKRGWYEFKEAVGMGDSSENQSAINKINADIDARKKAISAAKDKVTEYQSKAALSLAGINMSWNSEKSLADITGGLKASLGIDAPGIPGMDNLGDGSSGIDKSASTDTAASSIATGGSKNTSITITLGNLVENIVFNGSYEDNRGEMITNLENALIRVLQMARSAQ